MMNYLIGFITGLVFILIILTTIAKSQHCMRAIDYYLNHLNEETTKSGEQADDEH